MIFNPRQTLLTVIHHGDPTKTLSRRRGLDLRRQKHVHSMWAAKSSQMGEHFHLPRHTSSRRRRLKESSDEDDDREDSEEKCSASVSAPRLTSSHQKFGRIRYNVARHSDPGGCFFKHCVIRSHEARCYSMENGSSKSLRPRLICPPKLFFPVAPQIRYVSERIVEVFTGNAKGKVELHHILHPNMPRHVQNNVEALDLTDGLPRHRITARDVVDRTPFSVYGTFHGKIAIVKATCSSDVGRLTCREILQGKNPIMATRINQMDNSLLAATEFQCIRARTSLTVLDLVSQSRTSIESRNVFKASTYSNMLDVCWLWDHPSRLLLSTTYSLRLFDIRCPNRTEQALFLDRGVTHLASNRFRPHLFAGFNDDEVHIYDSRQLFGPIQQIKVPIDGDNGLSSLRWNPYMPYELLLHFRDSPRILRCNVHELGFDPFRRRVLETFKSDDIFSIEQIWEGGLSPEVVNRRSKRYTSVDNCYPLLSYGEMYDKCKEDLDAPMPLCWMTPAFEKAFYFDEEEDCSIDAVFGESSPPRRLRRASIAHEADVHSLRPVKTHRIFSDTVLFQKPTGSADHLLATPLLTSVNRVLYEQTRSKLIGRLSRSHDDLTKEDEAIRALVLLCDVRRGSSSSTLLNRPVDEGGLDNDQTPVPEPVSTASSTHTSVSHVKVGLKTTGNNVCTLHEIGCETKFGSIHKTHKEKIASIFGRLGLDFKDVKTLYELKKDVGIALNDERSHDDSACSFFWSHPCDNRDSVTGKKVDNGHRIKLTHKIRSFDFAPIGYSGVLCLVEDLPGRSKLIFAPFIAPDEGFRIKPELIKMFEEIRMWETFDSIPYNLYQTMESRLYHGMDQIPDQKALLSIFQGLAKHLPKRWMQWILSSARRQPFYRESLELSDFEYTTSDGDDPSSHEKTSMSSLGCPYVPKINVKGLPGILQLCSLEREADVTWQNCDSSHFTFIKIARSPVRRMILEPFCLPVTEDKIVSDEKFAASTDILKQIPVIYLCLINGDTIRFIEYTMFIRHKLGKPVFTNSPCSFLNAFHFFSSIVSRYVNKISCATNKSTPSYVARRLRLVDKIEAFIREHRESALLNPLLIPMLLFLLGELTATNPEKFTELVLENSAMPLGLKIAWCVNLLSSCKMKEAFQYLFQQSVGMDRLQFVGLGRHPDSLLVLSEFLYATKDCQVFSHLLVAGRCLEQDDHSADESESDDCSKSDVDIESLKDPSTIGVPSLFAMFPQSYMRVTEDMPDFLHLARAELCRYSFILQRMERFCFRRRLLNLVPQIYWPDFKTTVDISCTFCGSSYEAALRNAESMITDQISQVRSRPAVTRASTNRSSASISSNMAAMALHSDSEMSTMAATPSTESYYDYNGVDGGTEAEIKRPPDSACPQCRKSYPRCSLCGLSYGTPVNDYDHPAGSFSMMFSTCLMCSHGGHMKHVISWFEKEDECPVLGCDCRCLYLEKCIS
ncbi:hypothetical protein GCK32_000017 [Trichostrongylus colubriformis]|uniref:GATOR2 complex protein MIO zinc-ribbon like domain-containing protein n=1 Tax=Trichostrongylus colubriformis TaxID=6319 RepID=A0AAN8FJ51_TRICO